MGLNYWEVLQSKKGELNLLQRRLAESEIERKQLENKKETATQALEIVNSVLLETQMQVKGFVEEVVTTALQAVFGLEYSFEIEYEIKRNQSEACPYLVKEGQRFDVQSQCGGGVADVIGFALRMALFALATPSPEPVLILDEPGKHLSHDRQEVFAEMLRQVAEMFGVQMLVVSHSEDIINVAEKSFRVMQTQGVTKVEEV